MFWTNNLSILFNNNNYLKFFPNAEMTTIEKLNSIFRLSVYLGIALVLCSNNYKYFFLPIVIGVLTFVINKYYLPKIDTFFQKYNEECTQPTFNNPFMNINLITDNRQKHKACKPTEEIKEEIEDKFNTNLYRNVGDVFNKSHGQLNFHTMPSTTIPNDQTKFAKWLYKTGPTCKERTIDCTTQW
tara:strand:+ start:6039 stop:6593 length:555 start_codon:yes stop_codon:yes gene_type:complete